MTCGLPTFATLHGGPAEIIEHGVSGFHIDPYHPEQAANLMADFFERCKQDPDHWVKISGAGLQRIYEKSVLEILFYSWLVSSVMLIFFRTCCVPRYTWKIYSERLMTLAGVYGFWKYVSKLERLETRRYLEMFYILKFRELVCSVLSSLSLSITVHGNEISLFSLYFLVRLTGWLLLSVHAGEDRATCN
jgi:sucrose synthase